ncbi:MAG: polyhydroxyalkanoic acid system family protein [Pseudomonadota bacterium]
MPRPVTITLSHDLGLKEARKRIRDGSSQLQGQIAGGMLFKFQENWTSDDRLEFTAKGLGQTITGEIDVFPEHVRITATLPSILATIAETIAGKVEKEGRLLLEKK